MNTFQKKQNKLQRLREKYSNEILLFVWKIVDQSKDDERFQNKEFNEGYNYALDLIKQYKKEGKVEKDPLLFEDPYRVKKKILR